MPIKNKISLIIPVYNVENELEDSLKSAINQTLKDIEIICVNDGSTDNSNKILERYAKQDDRIKLINQSNQGLSAARNAGMKLASGEFITFLDSDDTLKPKALEKMYKHAKENNLLLLIASYEKRFVSGEVIVYHSNIGVDPIKNLLNGLIRVPACAKLYDRQMLVQNGFEFTKGLYHEDDLSSLEILFYAKDRVGVLNEPIYEYVLREGSISKTFNIKHAKDLIIISDKKRECLVNHGVLDKYKNYLFKHTLALLYYYLNTSKPQNDAKKIIVTIFLQLKDRDYFTKELFLWLKDEFFHVYIDFVFLLLRWCKDIADFDSKEYFREFINEKDLNTLDSYALKFEFLHEIYLDYLLRNNIREIAIYGVGEVYHKLAPLLKKQDIKIIALMDKKAENAKFYVDDIEVLTYQNVLLKFSRLDILITSINVANDIKKELLEFCQKNHKKHNIIDFHKNTIL